MPITGFGHDVDLRRFGYHGSGGGDALAGAVGSSAGRFLELDSADQGNVISCRSAAIT
jgi:hypothetical protein